MSMSASLSNAMSGLSAASRAAELVSANVANSMTESYGRRELSLSAATVGGQGTGVQVNGVTRVVNQVAMGDRRLAEAEAGYYQERAEFFATIEGIVGTPDQVSSLSAVIDEFDQALIIAGADPSSETRLNAVVETASDLANKFNTISDRLQSDRESIDHSIGTQVKLLNTALEDVNQLNREIRLQVSVGGDASGLMDQRQAVIDQISAIVPIQEVAREYGQVALLTENGTTLVDYQAAQFEFTETLVITPDMSLTSGALSSLQIIGAASTNGTALDSIVGGSLAAAFELRDVDIPSIQVNLDALARNIIERATTADITLSAGQSGLFTDGGGAFDPLDEVGLASRLSVNSAVISSEGGELWRVRDGIGSAISGSASDNTLLSAMEEAFSNVSQPASGVFFDAGSSSALIGDFISQIGQARQTLEQRQSFSTARTQAFLEVEQSTGVDTDQEMQKLLLIEQAYAANAKIIQAVDEMLQELLSI